MEASPRRITSIDGGASASFAWFGVWALIGAGWALALLGAMTIGIFILPVVGAATVVVARSRRSHVGVAGLLAGLALPLFYVAYLNRGGPGMVCRSTSGGGENCVDEWSPWPWFASGVCLIAVGVLVFLRSVRPSPPPPPPLAPSP